MFLDYIEISNFRPFYGTQRINFGYNKDQNLTVILADNGSGKTSLVNALTWCLYDKEKHDVRNKSEPLYNLKAASEAELDASSGAEIKVMVKIRFYYFENDENGVTDKKYFVITRELTFQKWGNIDWESSFDSYLIVDETDKETLEDDAAQLAINSRIPEDMFQYFFFNGATLSNYFNNESELNLKTSVEQISQIDLINNVKDHLKGTLSALNTRFKNKQPRGEKNFNKQIEDKTTEKFNLESERDENYKKIDIAIENITKFEDKLKKADSNHANELNKKRSELESQKMKIDNQIISSTKEYEKLILELYPIAVLSDELIKSIEIADDAKEKKTAPALIEGDILKDILDDGVCICGTKLDEHPECVEELLKRLKNTSKVKQETFYDNYYAIKKVLSRLNDLPKIESIKQAIENDKWTKKSLEVEINRISDELITFDLEDVKQYEKQLQQNKKFRDDLRIKNNSLNGTIDRLGKEIEQLKDQREKSEKLSGELQELSSKIKFCENALDIVSDLTNNVQKHIREKINKNTREQFTSINWAYNKFTDVTIEQDYKINITKSSGQVVSPGDLSDGEENLLALSFMMALHSLSGFEIPLIIDAPLEKLDKGKRIEFISGLHAFTADKQIVFLFTDSQYTDDVRSNMIKNIVDEYELKPYENKTEIVKHG